MAANDEHVRVLRDALFFFQGLRVFVTTRERIKQPEGSDLFDDHVIRAEAAIRALSAAPPAEPVGCEVLNRLAAEGPPLTREHMALAGKAVAITGAVPGAWVKLSDAIEHAEAMRDTAPAQSAEIATLQRERDGLRLECRSAKVKAERMAKVLAAIHMRCAPKDIAMPDGRTMRFVPPDPEFYWRELSAKVNAVQDELLAIFNTEGDAAALAGGDRG